MEELKVIFSYGNLQNDFKILTSKLDGFQAFRSYLRTTLSKNDDAVNKTSLQIGDESASLNKSASGNCCNVCKDSVNKLLQRSMSSPLLHDRSRIWKANVSIVLIPFLATSIYGDFSVEALKKKFVSERF